MLPHEIEPFAQAHITAIDKIRDEIIEALAHTHIAQDVLIERSTIEDWADQLRSTSRALYRFQVCMIDEHKMKERLHEKNLFCRLNHK